jgi:hypothetical protein
MDVYVLEVNEVDQYYNDEDNTRTFKKEADALIYVSAIATGSSKDKVKKIYRVNTLRGTLQLLELKLIDFKLTFEIKKEAKV